MSSQKEDKEIPQDELCQLLKVEKPEAFWIRQRYAIMNRIQPRRRSVLPLWTLVPLLGAALVTVLFWRNSPLPQSVPPISPTPPPVSSALPPAQDWDLLENLDLLENWDKIHQVKNRPL